MEIDLDPQENVISEAGAIMYMSDQVAMETIFGDGSVLGRRSSMFER